jgi:hypothetical protein
MSWRSINRQGIMLSLNMKTTLKYDKMKKQRLLLPVALALASVSCNNSGKNTQNNQAQHYAKGTFGYDLNFLQKQDSGLVVLKNKDGETQLIVSAKYQAKVFTSTAQGLDGQSFGWVHYPSFDTLDAHMNAYGGENRFWLGPEGGKYSLFFMPGKKMTFDNWHTPAPFDSQPWAVASTDDSTSVTLHKDMRLENHRGAELSIAVKRKISLLNKSAIDGQLHLPGNNSVSVVGYRTDNTITNTGDFDWTEKTGMPCIWILDMFNPSPSTVIVVPFHKTSDHTKIATTDYFGEIPPDRIKYTDSILLFKADGKSRGKLGLTAKRAKGVQGSYDAVHHVLTIVTCQLDPDARYLNQEWDTVKAVFSGDAQNSYNDGPLADGSQMGPFYEMESVSPAAMLKAGGSLSHSQSVFHFTGNEKSLDPIARQILGIPIDSIRNAFK